MHLDALRFSLSPCSTSIVSLSQLSVLPMAAPDEPTDPGVRASAQCMSEIQVINYVL